MSSAEVDAIVTFFSEEILATYCQMSVGALYFYDWLILFDKETSLFWRRPITGAGALYFLNNSYILWAVFSGLRAFVLSQSWMIGTLVLILSCAPIGVNYTQLGFHYSGLPEPLVGCLNETEYPPNLSTHSGPNVSVVIVLARAPLIVADIIIIAISWWRLRGQLTWSQALFTKRLTLAKVFLRDGNVEELYAVLGATAERLSSHPPGTIYFIVLLVFNVLHMAFSLTSVFSGGGEGSNITAFTDPITAILISRFLLNIQEANLKPVHFSTEDSPIFTSRSTLGRPRAAGDGGTATLRFARFVDSIGAELEPEDFLSGLSSGSWKGSENMAMMEEVGDADGDRRRGEEGFDDAPAHDILEIYEVPRDVK
ncbi:uncharacterized protein BXZ73DRAFT_104878 [Epithele typhae]|uniref:uncharacterized protein n=1 Tax=Epithele typhae TaxID=378194 RepID=UPI0020085AD4|nr:uncharacterized protein BXZ73DRAFT_104878 [Epithele typhae]KAH9919770.1 hypothetical protein BXZ73DRAFT_104878 [Epithele typhae]